MLFRSDGTEKTLYGYSLMDSNVAGPVCSGAIANYFGYAMVFWSTAIAFFLAACVIIWNFRGEKEI